MKKLSKALSVVLGMVLGLGVFSCQTETSSPDPTMYTVTISSSIEHGTVTADKTSGIAEGETVTLTATPADNYELDSISVNDGAVTLSGTGNTRTFTMPTANVTVNATFKAVITVTYIGSKAPSEAKEVGDIVFIDGSASSYTESLTDTQKNAAVAVIFDANNKLGVGLETATGKAWCIKDVTAFDTKEYATSRGDGKANTDEIAGLEDYSEEKYPAFWYCTSYSTTGFTSGWYLPAWSELIYVYINREAVGNAFTALGKTNPFTSGVYWSSSQHASDNKVAYNYIFSSGNLGSVNKGTTYSVCAVRAF